MQSRRGRPNHTSSRMGRLLNSGLIFLKISALQRIGSVLWIRMPFMRIRIQLYISLLIRIQDTSKRNELHFQYLYLVSLNIKSFFSDFSFQFRDSWQYHYLPRQIYVNIASTQYLPQTTTIYLMVLYISPRPRTFWKSYCNLSLFMK